MLVSIAIINYNNGLFLERAIRSCQNQFRSSHNIEIIIIDDCSNDSSQSVLHQFKNSCRIYKNTKNLGAGFCSHKALQKARGKYFIRVDSDDYLSQISISTMVTALEENNDYKFVFGNLQVVDLYGIKKKVIFMNNNDNLIDHGAGILFKKSLLNKIGGYNKSLRHGEDIDLMLRIKQTQAKGLHLPICFYRYYHHTKNKSKTPQHANAKVQLRKKYEY